MTNFSQKYAATSLSGYVFEDANVAATINDYANGRRSGGLLLHGPNGTGKSTIALLMTRHSLAASSISEGWLSILHANADDIEEQLDGLFTNTRWQKFQGSAAPIGIINEADLLSLRLQYRVRQFLDDNQATILTESEK
jgi:hypothetical protein